MTGRCASQALVMRVLLLLPLIACLFIAEGAPLAHAQAHQSASVAMRREPRRLDARNGDLEIQLDARASVTHATAQLESEVQHSKISERHEVQHQGNVILKPQSRPASHHKKNHAAGKTHAQLVRESIDLLRLSHSRSSAGRSRLLVPSVPLISGTPVKIKNTRAATYLAACTSCDGVASTTALLGGACSGLLGAGHGCMFAVDPCVGGTFQIIKVGASMGTAISSGDLVMLKSMPSADGDSDFFAFAGTCGVASAATCADSAAFVRLYKGNASNPSTLKPMPAEIMWTISKLEGEGNVLLGEFVSFNKASVTADSPAAGTNLAVCTGNASATALQACGARSNVYTRQIDDAVPEESRNLAVWQVEADFNATCADPADNAVVNTHAGTGHEIVLGGTSSGVGDDTSVAGESGDDDDDGENATAVGDDDDAEGLLVDIDVDDLHKTPT